MLSPLAKSHTSAIKFLYECKLASLLKTGSEDQCFVSSGHTKINGKNAEEIMNRNLSHMHRHSHIWTYTYYYTIFLTVFLSY